MIKKGTGAGLTGLMTAVLLVAGCCNDAAKVRTDVPQKAFYKDIFMDSGMGMMAFRTMPVVDYLSLQCEYFYAPALTDENQALQDKVFGGCEEDLNGVLLYPDGEPRFRIFYVNGGLGGTHGRTLGEKGREHIRQFVAAGGSYVGSCAGAFLSAAGVAGDSIPRKNYLGLWPGYVDDTDFTQEIAYDIPAGSPLLQYYDFGGSPADGALIDTIHHENGPFFSTWAEVPGTEVLAINKAEGRISDGQPSVVAYKADVFSGRVIPSGGHPEQVPCGKGRDLMASYVRYAIDGQGAAKVKAQLSNGEVRVMDKSTTDSIPEFTMIGDLQCHHFVFSLPRRAKNVKIRLESLADHNLSLLLAKETFAFREDALYQVVRGDGGVRELSFDTLDKGLWYIGVQSEETVEYTEGEHGYEYGGKTSLLNGTPYSISVSWE